MIEEKMPTAPRRKQAKPQRLAMHDGDDELPAKRECHREPQPVLSIEEKFRAELHSDLKSRLLAAGQADENCQDGALGPALDLSVGSGAESKGSTALGDLLRLAENSTGNLLLHTLSPQQLLQFYAAVGPSRSPRDAEPPEAVSPGSAGGPQHQQHHARQHHSLSCLLSPPNSSGEELALLRPEDAAGCPAPRCGRPADGLPALLLHLAADHPDLALVECERCKERLADLPRLARHRCAAEARCDSAPPAPSAQQQQHHHHDHHQQQQPHDDNKEAAQSSRKADQGAPHPHLVHVVVGEPRANSVPVLPVLWPSFSLAKKGEEEDEEDEELDEMDKSRESSQSGDQPPVLLNENPLLSSFSFNTPQKEQNPFGFSLPSLLPGLGSNGLPPFSQHMFPPTIPQFVPPSASTPPRHRAGSAQPMLVTDDDWESMMEVSNTDEMEKIRQLVGDNAIPTTDPNQCLLCRRVLSCKSALQMHYRTHTGDRPFKCKICQRAFTTKGNLKTHMGVHRAKHSVRGVPSAQAAIAGLNHQCPICQRRFFSPQQLQAHIQEHMGRTGLPAGTPNGFAHLLNDPSEQQHQQQHHQQQQPPQNRRTPDSAAKRPPSPHLASLLINNNPLNFLPPGFLNLGLPLLPFGRMPAESAERAEERAEERPAALREDRESAESAAPKKEARPEATPAADDDDIRIEAEIKKPSPAPRPADKPDSTASSGASTASTSRPEGATPDKPDKAKLEDNPLLAMQMMYASAEPSPPVRSHVTLSKHQCAVCFKHFSSSSALQIHMRTHTGDKPFKCEVCGRAFTTRGNLKVHMGTHSMQTSPSRRGRRIFDYGAETMLRAGNPFAAPPPLPAGPLGLPPVFAGLQPFLSAMAGLHKPTDAAPINLLQMLQTVCTVCQKVCASPAELTDHLQSHTENEPESATA